MNNHEMLIQTGIALSLFGLVLWGVFGDHRSEETKNLTGWDFYAHPDNWNP